MLVLYGRYTGFAVLKCLLDIDTSANKISLYQLNTGILPSFNIPLHGTFGDFNWWFDDFGFNVHSTNYNHEYYEAS